IRDDVVLLGVVSVVVDAEHDRDVGVGGGSRDDDLLRAGVEVLLRAVAVGEKARRLDDELDFEVPPGQRAWVLLREHLQLGLTGLDDAVSDLDVVLELPEDGVVLQEMSHRLDITQVVDRDDVEGPAALEVSPEEVPPDPPETVDPHTRLSHGPSLTAVHPPP